MKFHLDSIKCGGCRSHNISSELTIIDGRVHSRARCHDCNRVGDYVRGSNITTQARNLKYVTEEVGIG